MMIFNFLFICLPLAVAQIPVYLRTPALPASVIAASPVAQLQCLQQCMPSCLPSCLVAQYPSSIYQPYPSVAAPAPYQILPSVAPQPVPIAVPAVSSGYQPYGASVAYIPVIPSCINQCMPTCAPTCVDNTAPPPSPQRDDLPTPPPETVPTPAPELPTTTVPTDVVPCKCLIKITITQGGKATSKCGPNSCSCPQGYNQCGSNCCRA